MIPQYSWRCDGMRVRAPTDAASEKARDRGEAKRQYAAQQMDLPSRTDASNRKHFLCRPAAPLQAPTRRVSKATNGVTPGPLHSRRRVVQGIQPPTLRHQRHPRTALPSPPRPQRCPKSSTKAPRPGHPAHGTSMRPIRVPKNRNTPKIATFLRLRIAARRQNADWRPEKRQIGRTAAHFRLAEDGKESAIAKKLHRSRNFCFCETDRRNGAVLAKDTCAFNANQAEQQHGTTAHRPYKHSCPHPWQRSRASSTEKCNI